MIDQCPSTICTLFERKQEMSTLTSDWWHLTSIDETSEEAVPWSFCDSCKPKYSCCVLGSLALLVPACCPVPHPLVLLVDPLIDSRGLTLFWFRKLDTTHPHMCLYKQLSHITIPSWGVVGSPGNAHPPASVLSCLRFPEKEPNRKCALLDFSC